MTYKLAHRLQRQVGLNLVVMILAGENWVSGFELKSKNSFELRSEQMPNPKTEDHFPPGKTMLRH